MSATTDDGQVHSGDRDGRPSPPHPHPHQPAGGRLANTRVTFPNTGAGGGSSPGSLLGGDLSLSLRDSDVELLRMKAARTMGD